MKRRFSSGFTLVELMVVIAIIGLLSSFAVVSFRNAKEKARVAAAQHLSRSILDGIGEYAVGVWGFDECAGSAVRDGSGQGHNGTMTYGTTWSTDTPLGIGCSLTFDSAVSGETYVDPDFTWALRNNSFTVSLWIKTATDDSGVILSQDDTPILLEGSNGYLHTCLTSPTCATGSKRYNDGKWHLIIVTGNQDSIRIFVDNLSTPYMTTPNTPTTLTGNLAIGHLYHGGWGFTGLIDDVNVYQAEVMAR
ncbi:MAG: prepilin-type N-terminal cleavage/methylation domain-containing protein [Candidatus Uhrbacteria bacterium]|nr:prepilin-type N-terminal cleavage/methylation domain-containing protein [Candidatus Uhrbacteria bacterium]